MAEKEFVEKVTQNVEAASDTSSSLFSLNLILEALLGSSLKAIWSVINTLQIICYLEKVKANLSPHAIIALDKLRRIAFLEFIPY